MQPKDGVFVNGVVVEVEGDIVHRLDKAVIDRLIEEVNERQGYPEWVVDRSGIRFATERECALPQSS